MNEQAPEFLKMALPVDSFWLPEGASVTTPSVDEPFWLIYWTCVAAFVITMVPMFWFFWKYRRKSPDQKAESQTDHNQLLEIAWSAVPLAFFVLIFVWGFRGFLDLQTPPGDAMVLRVTGQKWQWTVKYDAGVTVTGQGATIPVPQGKPVKLVMTSVDVLHSFFIPNFRTKMDVIPWRYTTLWFNAEKVGEFPVFCTEYCGQDHSNMLAKIQVMPQAEFDAWLEKAAAEAGGPATLEKGQEVYNTVCLACHSNDGTPRVGPTFKGLAGSQRTLADGSTVTADDDYLMRSILEPNAQVVQGFPPAMPPMAGTLNQTQIESIILYIKSLK